MTRLQSSGRAARERDILVDGRRVRYVDAGDGPVIVLIHGLGGSWQNWVANLPDLARDHRTIALDLPGFGRSDPIPRPRGLAPYTAAVAALLERLDAGSALVVGHSMSGLVAERLSLQRPELVDAWVLVAAGGGGVGVRQALAVHGMLAARRLAARPAVARRLARVRLLRHRALAGVVHDPACIPAGLAEDTMAAFVAPGFADAVRIGLREDLRANLGQIGCPALLLWGDRDRILPCESGEGAGRPAARRRARSMARRRPLPDARAPGRVQRPRPGLLRERPLTRRYTAVGRTTEDTLD